MELGGWWWMFVEIFWSVATLRIVEQNICPHLYATTDKGNTYFTSVALELTSTVLLYQACCLRSKKAEKVYIVIPFTRWSLTARRFMVPIQCTCTHVTRFQACWYGRALKLIQSLCMLYALWYNSYLSRVYPTSHPMSAWIGSCCPCVTLNGKAI